MTKNLLLALALSLTACSSKSKCEQVYDHTMSILPDDMKKMIGDAGKDKAIAKCEASSDEAKQCALDAKSMEDLMKCPKK
jgi:hypothetical protein